MIDGTASVIGLAPIVGPTNVRGGIDSDAVDGVRPGAVVAPLDADTVAAVLAWCTRERRTVVVCGGGTKLAWGRRPDRVDVLVTTRALHGVTRYEPGDLTVTAGAGTTIAALNDELARHGQRLPLDAPGAASTIGGAIATNDSGPLRHRYGAPRDQLIGVSIATADGRVAKAGGNVVKNVAGYDLGRLMAGSFGSLAAIVSASFKLAPVPAATRTVDVVFHDRDAIAGAAADIAASQLDPVSIEVHARATRSGATPTYRLLVRQSGMDVPVAAQTAAAARLAAAWGPVTSAEIADDALLWRERAAAAWRDGGAIVKASWLPADLAAVLALLDELTALTKEDVELEGRAALGVGTLRLAGEATRVVQAVQVLRERSTVVGNVVVVRADAAVKNAIDVWGMAPGAATVSRLLKGTLDPAGVLNAGRGPM